MAVDIYRYHFAVASRNKTGFFKDYLLKGNIPAVRHPDSGRPLITGQTGNLYVIASQIAMHLIPVHSETEAIVPECSRLTTLSTKFPEVLVDFHVTTAYTVYVPAESISGKHLDSQQLTA